MAVKTEQRIIKNKRLSLQSFGSSLFLTLHSFPSSCLFPPQVSSSLFRCLPCLSPLHVSSLARLCLLTPLPLRVSSLLKRLPPYASSLLPLPSLAQNKMLSLSPPISLVSAIFGGKWVCIYHTLQFAGENCPHHSSVNSTSSFIFGVSVFPRLIFN